MHAHASFNTIEQWRYFVLLCALKTTDEQELKLYIPGPEFYIILSVVLMVASSEELHAFMDFNMFDMSSRCNSDVRLYERIPSRLRWPVLSITSSLSTPDWCSRVAVVALNE